MRALQRAQDTQQGQQEAARKLRILCLHGFRQTGATLRQRLKQLTAGLSDIADFEFIDAPHALPFLYKAVPEEVRASISVTLH